MIKTSNAGRQDEPRGEPRLAHRLTATEAHGAAGRRRVLTLASIATVLVGLVTVATHPLTAHAALGDINAFAGSGSWGYSGDGGPATSASLNQPQGVAEDAAGNVYIADQGNNVIRKVDPSGNITTYAGNGTGGYAGDGGPAASAELNQPYTLGLDSAGNLLVADYGNNRIRAVSPLGTITTVAGTGTGGYSGDGGAAISATLSGPLSVTGLSGGGFLIGDIGNNVVRKVDASGTITTIAGNGIGGFAGDGGAATSAELNEPIGTAVDSAGDVFIADCSNYRVRKVSPSGTITTIAGTGTSGFAGDGGPAASAEFNCPYGLVLSGANLYVGDYGNGAIRKIDAAGNVTTIAGQGVGGINNHFNRVTQDWIDGSGRLLFADWWDARVWVQDIADLLSVTNSAPLAVTSGQTFAYSLNVSNPGGAGTATGVTLSDPLPAGVTFVSATASSGTCSQSGGTVTCALGTLTAGSSDPVTITVTAPNATTQVSNTATVTANETDPAPADNSATAVTYVNPADLSVTGTAPQATAGSPTTQFLYVSNGGPSSATGVTLNATLSPSVTITAASTSQGTCTPSGATLACTFGNMGVGSIVTVSLAFGAPFTSSTVTDAASVSSSTPDQNPANNTASVQTTVSGVLSEITTFAGNGNQASTGDGGPATSASLNIPQGVAEDGSGNVYIAEFYGQRIRKVDPSGVITTFAGNGTGGYSGDGGPATSAQVDDPAWLSFDAAGDLLIAENGNNVIRAVNMSTGIIRTVAGDGYFGYSGDGGPATAAAASLGGPQSVVGLPGGGFLIGDHDNNVVRKVDASGTITTIAGNGTSGYSGDGGPATSAELSGPSGVAVDPAGDVYIADGFNNAIRKVDTAGKITTVASISGTPWGLALSAGNIYVSTNDGLVVQRIDPSGTITTVAGDGNYGTDGDGGPATSASLTFPTQILFDASANMLIAATTGEKVREVSTIGPDLLHLTGAAPLTVGPAQQVAYTFNVVNPGTIGPATGVTLSDPLPAGVSFVSATATQGACTAAGGTVTCALGQLPLNAYDTVTITGTAPSTVGALTNTATVSANETDPALGDNTSTLVTHDGQVDVSVSQTASTSSTAINQPFTFSMGIASRGAATGVTLTDTLPSNLAYVSSTTSQGTCSATGATVTCALGAMGDGGVANVAISVNPVAPGGTPNTAMVSADQPDFNTSNNSASAAVAVQGADLGLTVTVPPSVQGIQPLAYTLVATNAGPYPATSVTLSDTIPSGATYNAATATQGTCSQSGGTVTCHLGTLAMGASATATLTVSALASAIGTHLNDSAIVAADPATSFDPNPADNAVSTTTFVNPTACGEVITTSTKLSANIGPCYGDGVIIGADNITLDLNGHSILGLGGHLDDMAGIRLPVRTSVTVQNGSVTGFAAGIFVNSGGGNTFSNVNVHDNIGPGSSINAFSFEPNFGDGILLQHSAANRILNSTITHNGVYDGIGIFGEDANFNLIQGNTISKNSSFGSGRDGEGIALDSFLELGDPRRGNSIFGNNIIGNTIVDNGASGISSVANVNGQYLNNDIERNGLDKSTYPREGIGLQAERSSTRSTDVLVQGNKVMGNGDDGIQVLGTTGNMIKNNTTGGNGANVYGPNGRYGVDLRDTNGDCSSNVWTGNTYGSGGVSPACLASTNQGPAASAASAASGSPQLGKNANQVGPRHGSPLATGPAPAAAHAAAAAAPSTTPSCGSVVTTSITLTADLGPCSGAGLVIGADNITVNLGGHKIVGNGTGDGTTHPGVYVFGHQGDTVTNGSISGFDAGVVVNMGAYATISSLNVHDNIGPTAAVGTLIPYATNGPQGPFPTPVMSDGIAVFHSFGVQVVNNTVTHNGSHAGIGVYGVDTNANTVKGNTVSNTVGAANTGGIGIDVTASLETNDDRTYLPIEANTIFANTVNGSQGAGIVSLGNTNGVIKANVVQNNGVGTSGSPRDGIQINFNLDGGASPRTVDTVLGNTVSGSGDNGIAVYSGGNTMQSNTATGDNVNNDGSFDLFDSHAGCDHNTWKGNTSGSAGVSPSCA